jgi:alkylation response protein AidB-like acyl-CoA dehydrogenase
MLDDTDDFRQSVRRFARAGEQGEAAPAFDQSRWTGLGKLGVLGLGTASGGGGAVEIASVMEELGAAGFVGPLVEVVVATHVLPDAEADHLAEGGIAAVTSDTSIVPWGEQAEVVLLIDGQHEIWRCRTSALERVRTLGGDEWARGHVEPVERLGTHERAMAVGEVAIAGYVIGAGRRLLELSAAYARDRHQFGQPIGKFQAVSHPLGRCYARLESSRDLLCTCVLGLDTAATQPTTGWVTAARVRLLAVNAAEEAAEVALQVHGGMGFVENTIVTRLARRIRHVSLLGRPLAQSTEVALGTISDGLRHDAA